MVGIACGTSWRRAVNLRTNASGMVHAVNEFDATEHQPECNIFDSDELFDRKDG